jgi:hypothetical protein
MSEKEERELWLVGLSTTFSSFSFSSIGLPASGEKQLISGVAAN